MVDMSASTATQGTTPQPADKVLVTGAGGFVGRYVVRELIANGFKPVCLVRNPSGLTRQLPEQMISAITFVTGDLLDRRVVDSAARDCRAAIHLVGIIEERPRHGRTFERIHVEGTRAVVDACRTAGVRRYAHMSALGTRPDAVSRYHQTKWLAERIVGEAGLDWTIFRPSLIHGPDGDFMRMMKFFCTSKIRQPVMPYFGSGTNLCQPVSVRDVAACFVGSLSLPETIGRIYELGGPEQLTWKELYDLCAERIVGHPRLKLSVPVFAARWLARTIIPLAPSVLVPYKFNVDQIQMSQEDNICDITAVEETFGIQFSDFRRDLAEYADRIP